MSVNYQGLGENTEFGIQLDAGVLTNRLFGEYNYEGGNQVYTVTYGSRSLREPEVQEPEATETEGEDNTVLYVAVAGIAAVIILAAVAVVIGKKKKSNKAESK